MATQQVVFTLVTFLHDLFTVVWIGGLFTLILTVLPAAKKVWGPGPQVKQLLDAIQKRLSPLVYGSIVGLALTGLLLARRNPAFGGLFSFANPYAAGLAAKHLLMLAMVAVTLVRSVALRPRGRPRTPRQEKLSLALLLVNGALGLVVLFLSALTAALAAGPPAA